MFSVWKKKNMQIQSVPLNKTDIYNWILPRIRFSYLYFRYSAHLAKATLITRGRLYKRNHVRKHKQTTFINDAFGMSNNDVFETYWVLIFEYAPWFQMRNRYMIKMWAQAKMFLY